MRLVITGSHGLVGTALERTCLLQGHQVIPIDFVRPERRSVENICDREYLKTALAECDGIVHLAAISRVAWGEIQPDLCHEINVEGTRAIVDTIASCASPPWLLFASSREVYGNPSQSIVSEDDAILPVNHYGRSKAEGERLVVESRDAGTRNAIVRLSNVYGGRRDHPDRAVPSLLSRALNGSDLTITGSENYFDFVHVEDTVLGLLAIVEQLRAGESALPPIQLTTGIRTTLGELAELAVETTNSTSRIVKAAPRPFDVSGFCGTNAQAARLLGWQPQIGLRQGMAAVAADLLRNGPLAPIEMPDPTKLAAARAAERL